MGYESHYDTYMYMENLTSILCDKDTIVIVYMYYCNSLSIHVPVCYMVYEPFNVDIVNIL